MSRSSRSKQLLFAIQRDLRAGIVILLPIAVTAWALLWLFRFFDGLLGRAISPLLPVPLPGLGILLLIGAIVAVGAVSRSPGGVSFILWLDRRLSRIPLASWVYGTATQITHSTIDGRRGTFKQCVLVEYPKQGSWVLAFVTGTAPAVMCEQLGIPDLVSIFVPTTPNPTSGFLLFVPKSETVDLGFSTELGFRLIISAGSVRVEDEDEKVRRALADFLQRI